MWFCQSVLEGEDLYARLCHYLLARAGPICTIGSLFLYGKNVCVNLRHCARTVKTYRQGRTYRSSDCVLVRIEPITEFESLCSCKGRVYIYTHKVVLLCYSVDRTYITGWVTVFLRGPTSFVSNGNRNQPMFGYENCPTSNTYVKNTCSPIYILSICKGPCADTGVFHSYNI